MENVNTQQIESPTIPPALTEGIARAKEVWKQNELPVMQHSDIVSQAFHDHNRVLIEAETGSGKTTVAPVLLLEEVMRSNPNARVVVTQPRRLAAKELWSYVGKDLIGPQYIGYHFKGDGRMTSRTQLEYTVERSLLNELVSDPTLEKYDAVMLDEIHERHIDIDIIMPLLKKTQQLRKERGMRDLKIVLASATVDQEKVLNFFDGADHVKIPGKIFPVEEHFAKTHTERGDLMIKAAEKAAEIIRMGEDEGDMLIFMPGSGEIKKTAEELAERIKDPNIEFVSLIGGDRSGESYSKIHEETDKRRIYIATNVAETSITIPKIKVVIDSGLDRTNVYDLRSGISSLQTKKHTQSNARQRKGRAGRKSPGNVYYLFTEEELRKREPFLQAEILRTDLATQVLLMKKLGIEDIQNFDFMDHPGKEKIDQALERLRRLGAIDYKGTLTTIGEKMAEIDADPRFSRMVVEAEKRGCLDAVSILVGIMGEGKKIFEYDWKTDLPFAVKYAKYFVPGNDYLTLLNVWNDYVKSTSNKDEQAAWGVENGIKTGPLKDGSNSRKDILKDRKLPDIPVDVDGEQGIAIGECIAVGLMDSILYSQGRGMYTLKNTDKMVTIDSSSSLAGQQPPMFIAGKIYTDEKSDRSFASFNMRITHDKIQKIAPYLADPLYFEKNIATQSPEKATRPPLFPSLFRKPDQEMPQHEINPAVLIEPLERYSDESKPDVERGKRPKLLKYLFLK